MRLLLDTHVAIWAVSDVGRLSAGCAALIEDPDNTVAVSIASVWEIAIKNGVDRRDKMPLTLNEAWEGVTSAFDVLPLNIQHLRALAELPPLHRDPFDRVMVATAIADTYRLVTHDRQLAAYGDHVMLV